MIRFHCKSCGQKINVAGKYAGKKGKCPKCKNIVIVPRAQNVSSVETQAGSPKEASHTNIPLVSFQCSMCDNYMEAPESSRGKLLECPNCGCYAEVPKKEKIIGRVERIEIAKTAVAEQPSVPLSPSGDTIRYSCGHCGREVCCAGRWKGTPEVCPHCGYLHLVPDNNIRERQTCWQKRYKILTFLGGCAYSIWIPLLLYYIVFVKLLKQPLKTWVFVATMLIFCVLFPCTVIASRVGRIWLFEIDKDTEKRRAQNCEAVRASQGTNQPLRLCGACCGTGTWGWLSFTWSCLKCKGHGCFAET